MLQQSPNWDPAQVYPDEAPHTPFGDTLLVAVLGGGVEDAVADTVLLGSALASVLKAMLVLNGTVGSGDARSSQQTRVYSDHQASLLCSAESRLSLVRL